MNRKKLDFRKVVLMAAMALLTVAGAYAHLNESGEISLTVNGTVTARAGAFGGICNAAVLYNRILNSTKIKSGNTIAAQQSNAIAAQPSGLATDITSGAGITDLFFKQHLFINFLNI